MMGLLIPTLLGVSAVAYVSMVGISPLDNSNNNNSNSGCTTTVSFPEVAGGVIQNAINSAPTKGAVICISPGVYPEQIHDKRKVAHPPRSGTSHNPGQIQPTSVASDSVNPTPPGTTAVANIILVTGVTAKPGVTINNLLVDGSLASSSFSGCGVDYTGVLFLNRSVEITGSTVQNIYLPPADAGCQPGDGVAVETGTSMSSSVTISNDQILNYNKNGVACRDAGTTCTVTGNTVSFYAAYSPYIAPNGIEIAYGATGSVSQNTVSGNECNLASVCGPNLVTQTSGSGSLPTSLARAPRSRATR